MGEGRWIPPGGLGWWPVAFPGFEKAPSWVGWLGPARLPQPIVARLRGAIVKSLSDPQLKARLDENAYPVVANTPDEFAAKMKDEIARTAKLIKEIGLQPE